MMRSRLLLLVFAGYMFISAVVIDVGRVSASCDSVGGIGAVHYDIPNYLDMDSNHIWIRSSSDSLNYQYLIDINNECLPTDVSVAQPNQWVWSLVSVQGAPYQLGGSHNDNSYIRIIGSQPGVRLDKILIAESSCTPIGDGDNCYDGDILSDLGSYQSIKSPKGYVSGKVQLSTTPHENRDRLIKVEYIVNGRVVQLSNTVDSFDTELVPNGKTEVYIRTSLVDDNPIKEVVEVDIYNSGNPFAPIIRWFKLNAILGVVMVSLLLSVIISSCLLLFLRRRRKIRQEVKFKGLGF